MTQPSSPTDDTTHAAQDTAFFGHPRGLPTVSGLEVWERFSFLGMQVILVLYFADTVAHGGLDMDSGTAASFSAAYGTMVYLVSVGGGWLADRVLGSYRAVLTGGILIACGHYSMAVPSTATTWTGLGLISIGTGLLKPNVATMVGKLYRAADERRDSGFAVYYMAINIGSFLGPLAAGWLGQRVGWHWGFSAAAVGMTLGLVQYVLGRNNLVGHKRAEHALPPHAMRRAMRLMVGGLLAVAVVAGGLAVTGWLTMGRIATTVSVISMVAPVVYFIVLFRSPRVAPGERRRLRPYLVLWLGSVAFNFVLFQSYTVLALLAAEHADTTVLGWEFPSSWFNSLLGAAEVLLAPMVAVLWLRMGRRQPHTTYKLASGVVLGGLSFLVLVPAVTGHGGDWQLAAWWLLVSYLLLALGDVLLETTGMSVTSQLAPAAFSSQTMSLWFLSLALANGIQTQTVKQFGEIPIDLYLGINGGIAAVAGLVVIVAAPWLRRAMHPIR